MLAASENVAIPLEVYDTLMEEHNTLEEFVGVISDNVSLSWDKSRLVMDQEDSRDLLTLFRIKYPVAYAGRLERLQKEAEPDAGD